MRERQPDALLAELASTRLSGAEGPLFVLEVSFDVPECGRLLGASRIFWPRLPNGEPNR